MSARRHSHPRNLVVFLFSIFQFLVALSLLKTDNCELTTKSSLLTWQ